MKGSLIEAAQTPEGDAVFIFRESLDYAHVNGLWENATDLLNTYHPRKIILDFRNIQTIDSAGIAFLRLVWRHCQKQGIQVAYESTPPSAKFFLRYVESGLSPDVPKVHVSFVDFVSFVGRSGQEWIDEGRDLVRFFGDFLLASASNVYHLKRVRWRETLYYAQLAGSDAMPIVFLLSFLLGLVMAFQGAVQLRQFGANIYVADLLSLAFTRELGPVFTAIILAGRSGSAFAAEIGTMKVNEEMDALTVMGFDIPSFVILPKVYALALAGPLLTLLANASGILGGVVVGIVSLDLTAASFIEETYRVLSLGDVLSGLIKSLAFSILVALAGCFRGLQAEKGADSVGRQTTSAVVSGLFLIILADAIFTILFHIFKW